MPINKNAYKSKLLIAFAATAGLMFAAAAIASEEEQFEPAHNDVGNTASLQRGARNFVNYCYGCHSAKYVRFNRVATDLGLTDAQLKDNLMFTGERSSDTMQNAMSAADAKRWFGRNPPDLSLISRSRTPDKIYAFLKSFYVDPTRPTGVNNTVVPSVAMPDILWELQGMQEAEYEGTTDADGNVHKKFKGFKTVTKGKLTPEEYDEFVRDTVNFLDYIGEPVQLQRRNLGIGVLFFLLVLFGFAYFLKQEYWKDVT